MTGTAVDDARLIHRGGRTFLPRGIVTVVPSRILLLIGLIVIAVGVFSWLVPSFLSGSSLMNVARQATVIWIVAMGATFVITAGEIDLSVGSVVALVAVLAAWMSRYGYPIPVIMLASLGAGLMVGLVNGLLTLQLKVPSFLATLGTMSVARGLAMQISLEPIPVRSLPFIKFFRLAPLGIPMPVMVALGLTVVAVVLLHFSRFGIRTRAVGSNDEAARLAGLKVKQHKLMVMMLGSLTAAVGGIVFMGRTNYGMPYAGAGLELEVIAAVILGGTRLGGGVGSIVGTTLGALLLTVIFVGIATLGLPGPYQDIAKGAAIVFAILLMRR